MFKKIVFFGCAWLVPVVADVGETTALRWEKRDARGDAMAVDDGPWACVLDRGTGLWWETKSDNEGVHFAGSTYHRKIPEQPDGGGCVLAPHQVEACDLGTLVDRVNSKALCGYSDWRVPTSSELETLLLSPAIPGSAQTAIGFFPHTGREAYWAADHRAKDGVEEARVVHFGSGHRQWLPSDRVARLRLVRGPDSTEITR